MKCNVCDAEIRVRKKYDAHVVDFRIKTLVKKILPNVDCVIPSFLPRLKQHSSGPRIFQGRVKVCSDCGHGEMEHPPTAQQLQAYYQARYWSERSHKVRRVVQVDEGYVADPRANHQIDFVWSVVDGSGISEVLEIGAGAAYASRLLRDRLASDAVTLSVCEPGQQWTAYYQQGGIQKLADYFPCQTTRRFDYVHTSHWLEHTHDLDAAVSALADILNCGGYLFIEVPNTEHDYWNSLTEDSPHIHFFTRKSLTYALQRQRFRCEKIGEFGLTFPEWNRGVPITEDRYGPCEKGFWIRALFRKVS